MLFGTERGRVIYRVLDVSGITDTGQPEAYRYRLKCARLTRAEIPDCIPIMPWTWDPRRRRRPVA